MNTYFKNCICNNKNKIIKLNHLLFVVLVQFYESIPAALHTLAKQQGICAPCQSVSMALLSTPGPSSSLLNCIDACFPSQNPNRILEDIVGNTSRFSNACK